jgi:hypothetical protein
MKTILLITTFILAQNLFAESLLLKGDMDPREITLPQGYRLWSDVQAENLKNRPMREEVMTSCSLFLEGRISHSDFTQLLKGWADLGFNQQERIVLVDTLQKSNLSTVLKNQWLCRLDNDRNCNRIKIFPKHLSPILQKYDWLVIDGQAYPRLSWDEISIPDEAMTWIFVSARFETYTFKGKWEDLKFKNPSVSNWITGGCDDYSVQSEVQAMDNNVLLSRNCLKSSLIKPKPTQSFYDRNKDTIWIAAGVVLGIGAFNTLAGKNIVIDKPSFR